MNIRQAVESDREKWDNFVSSQPDSTPYHLFAWTRAVQNAYGFKSFNLIAEKASGVLGIFPMVMLKIPLMRPEMVALPYCDVGSVLSTSREVQAALLEEAITIARTNNAKTLSIRGQINCDLAEINEISLQEVGNKVRMVLHLPGSSAELWQGFKAKLRSQVRKAEKYDLIFQFANEKIDDFYTVFSTNMRDLGSPVHSKKWFEEIVRQFAANAKVGLVYCQGKVIGAGIILRVDDSVSIPWASTLRAYNNLCPNMLLYWKFLEYATDNGCTKFDFGRSTPGEGTYNFKRQWGAEPEPLNWYNIIFEASEIEGRSKSINYRLMVEKIWQRFPLGLANFIGPVIRRYISL